VWLCEDTGGYRLSRPLDHKSLRQVGLAGIEIPSVTNYRVLLVFAVPPRLSIQKLCGFLSLTLQYFVLLAINILIRDL